MKVNKTNALDRSGWRKAVALTGDYLKNPSRADVMLGNIRTYLEALEFARCERLFYGVLRNLALLRAGIGRVCDRRPSVEAEALLLVAGFELFEAGEDAELRAKVTHNAVETAGKILPEKMRGFVNAVLRKLPEAMINAVDSESDPGKMLALKFSHPAWLVDRWIGEFGIENAAALLEWDQKPSPVYLRIESGVEKLPANLKPTRWPGYFLHEGGGWAEIEKLLAAKLCYAQDPATRLCVELLDPKPGETALDLCSAPGGKARSIVSRMGGAGVLACVDLPGPRCARLCENLAGIAKGMRVEVVECDVLKLEAGVLISRGLPETFDEVLLDAPCSNTGVLRRRPDARWRLRETDIEKAANLQGKLLECAAKFVAPGGRLVYSTCSIEPRENDEVLAAFLKNHPEFRKIGEVKAYPWKDGHDGAGAFELRRV